MHKPKLLLAKLFVGLSIAFLACTTAQAAVYPMPKSGDDLIGQPFQIQVQKGDSTDQIRMRYEVSDAELKAANPRIARGILKVGDLVTIPTQYVLPQYRQGLVLNMAELKLYYFTPDGQYVYAFPVAMGRPNWRTPTMVSKIVKKQEDPTWYVPKAIQEYMFAKHGKLLPDVMPPGEENPLGEFALYLAKHGYLIHGTNEQQTVGTYASSGCMRLSMDAIDTLYRNVAIGTEVHIIHHASKAGWLGNNLYLEVHSPLNDLSEEPNALNKAEVEDAIEGALQFRSAHINWDEVYKDEKKHDGMPHIIGTRA